MALALLLLAVIGIFWIAGRQTPWSPTYQAPPLPASVVRASAGPVYDGAQLFHRKACLNCHRVEGYGGRRGPDLTDIAARKTAAQMIAVIKSGGRNMPAYGSRLAALELSEIVAFLESRKQGLRH
jgi:ubiquinol-cytochrome c reductase cytochrome b subunit